MLGLMCYSEILFRGTYSLNRFFYVSETLTLIMEKGILYT